MEARGKGIPTLRCGSVNLRPVFGAVANSTLANATMLDAVGLAATCRLTDACSTSRSLTTSRTCHEQYQRYRRYLQHCSFRDMDTFCFDVTPFQYVGVESVPEAGQAAKRTRGAFYWFQNALRED